MNRHLKKENEMETKPQSGEILNILSLEDSVRDFNIICEELTGAGYRLNISRVDKEQDFEHLLLNNKYDIILADFNLPGYNAFAALQLYSRICPDIPFIVISGAIGEETAIELVKRGAVDYVLKDRLKRLPSAVSRALEESRKKLMLRQDEEKLRESEQNYRTLADSGQALIWTAGADKLCNYFNRVWLNFTGRTLEQELGNGWTDGVHPDDLPGCMDTYTGSFDRRESFSMEYRLMRHDGEYRWILDEGCSRYDSNDNFIGYIGHCLDITDRKNTEEALRKSERKYYDLFSYAPIGIYLSTRDGKFITVNKKLVEILGYESREELMQMNLQTDIYWNEQEREMLITAHEAIGKVYNLEIKWKRKDGTPVWISLNTHIVKNESNEFLFFEGFVHDISARKQAEADLQELNVTLERRIEERTVQLLEANKEMEAFSYTVSHDLRAPLRGINGFTKLLMEEYAVILDDEGKRICSLIHDNTLKMGTLIDDLLEFSRLSRAELQLSPVNMKNLVESIFQELNDPGSPERIDLAVGDLTAVQADPAMIRQVWYNLLSNAIKYTSKKTKAIISINSRVEDGKCIFCIRDNGVGFEMKYVHQLFGVFQRLHSLKDFAGTGVGLAIVKRIVARHGGEVWAFGEPDRGAEFCFSLPAGDE